MQTIFFRQFYLVSKTNARREWAAAYDGTRESAQDLFQTENIWITELDALGTISNLSGDCLTVRLGGVAEEVQIPLYAMVSTFEGSPEESG